MSTPKKRTTKKRRARSTRVDPPSKATAPITFAAFVDSLGVTLTRGQRVLTAVAFDGREPKNLRGKDREVARELFGDVDVIPPEARAVLVACCGARGGKSHVLIALRAVHLSLTCDLSALADGENAFAVCIAPDMRLARQALRFAAGAAKKLGALTAPTKNSFGVQRPDDKTVIVECLPASEGGSAGRGRSLVFAGMDEAAFFRDADHAVNDVGIFKSMSPRVLPDGQLVIASTTYAKLGLLWDFYNREWGKPASALVAHAPTRLLRDDAHTLSLIEREQARDPDNAATEFDAQFASADSKACFPAEAIDRCIKDRPALLGVPARPVEVFAGMDLAFRRDSSALVIVHDDGTTIRVAEVIELKPSKGKPLVVSEVMATFCDALQRHEAADVVADLVYIESAVEEARKRNVTIVDAPSGPNAKAKLYAEAGHMLAAGGIDISRDDDRLIRQLREVQATPTSGGGMSITSPRKGGAHGDIASALMLALSAARWHRKVAAWEGAGDVSICTGRGIDTTRDLKKEREAVEREKKDAAQLKIDRADRAAADERRQRDLSAADAMLADGCAVPEHKGQPTKRDPYTYLVDRGLLAVGTDGITREVREPATDEERAALRELYDAADDGEAAE